MLTFHPYGKQDIRIVSDLSRFEFESPTPKTRSRNPSPPSGVEHKFDEKLDRLDKKLDKLDEEFSKFEHPHQHVPEQTPPKKRKNMIDIAESNKHGNNYDYNDIYQYYMKPSLNSLNNNLANGETISTRRPDDRHNFLAYPSSIPETSHQLPYNSDAPLSLPQIPNDTATMVASRSFDNYKNKELPPVMNPNQYMAMKRRENPNSVYVDKDVNTLASKQHKMENQLVRTVMNRPLIAFPAQNVFKNDEYYQGRDMVITANFLIYLFEFLLAMVIITISSILLQTDDTVSKGIYRYFIADCSISLIISLCFMTTLINFERRNGSFYCTLAFIMSVVSFIITVSYIIPHEECPSNQICDLRKANSGLIIISTFLWLGDLIMFLTTLYISRLNLLGELNFDYSKTGFDDNKSISDSSDDNELKDPTSGEPLKEYYLNEHGEMFEKSDAMDLRGKNKIIVYTV